MVFKTGLFAILAGLAYFIFNRTASANLPEPGREQAPPAPERPRSVPKSKMAEATFLPAPTAETEVVQHTYFTLAYDEEHEQAAWVAYELTREMLNANWVERPNTFRPDPEVRTESATPRDYNSSGYDRGHLCPAADMAFDTLAIGETFYMSNMSPQVRGFNGGIWRELEELTRDWARRFKRLYIVTGPVLTRQQLGRIGFAKVTVPAAYYKVLYAPDQHRAIAFVMPNAVSERPVLDYAFDIDYVEKMTNLDFFPGILNGLNEELEASLDKAAWPIDERRYQQRLKSWNNSR
jgi:endonuclease G, mitochondrial